LNHEHSDDKHIIPLRHTTVQDAWQRMDDRSDQTHIGLFAEGFFCRETEAVMEKVKQFL
jgi:hypothetical protein